MVIQDSVYSIGTYAFADCKNLTAVDIPDSVVSIGGNAFAGCESLERIVLPNTVTLIAESTFSGCRRLAEVVLPEALTAIGYAAFSGCRSLTAITLPTSLKSIAYSVFAGCDSLDSVFYPGTQAQKSGISIGGGNDVLNRAKWHCQVTELSNDGQTVYLCGDCGLRYYATGDAAPLQELTLITLPDKLSYLSGEPLSLEGLFLEAAYADGTVVFLGADALESVTADVYTPGKRNAVLVLGGASAEFEIVVHDGDTVTLDEATYPESDHDYGSSLDETKAFTYPGAVSLAITFSQLTDVEADYDYIYIYDGADNQIASYTGAEAAGKTLTVPGDTFKVRLTSDAATTGYGYAFESIVACTRLIHVPVTDAATVTCTQAGLTEGSHCEVCDLVLVEQVQSEALGHDYKAVFDWGWEYQSCKATLSCTWQCGQQVTLDCQVTLDTTSPVIDVYTASVQYEGKTYTEVYSCDAVVSRLTVSGTVTAGNTDGGIWVQLKRGDSTLASVYTVDGTYLFTEVKPGDYTVQAYKEYYGSSEYRITLTDTSINLDLIIKMLGDVTGDDSVNIADVSKLYSYIKKDYSLEDVDPACDLTGDGKLTVLDVVMIYAHVKGTKPIF